MRLSPLALALFPALALGAAIDDDDLKLARSLMRPGYDLAGAQQQLLTGPSYVKDWWREATRSNLLLHDLNGDGLKDVFMAVEENPKIQGVEGVSCDESSR